MEHNRTYPQEHLEQKNATTLREMVYEAGDYTGRSGDIRQLHKEDHIFMLRFGIPLDTMLDCKEDAEHNDRSVIDQYIYTYGKPTEPDHPDVNTHNATDVSVTDSDIQGTKGKVKKTGDPLKDAIISAICESIDMRDLFDKEAINEAIHSKVLDEIEAVRRVSIEVSVNGGSHTDVGIQHKSFDKLLRLMALKENVMMVGPTGGGKTYAAHACADALDLPFYAVSVGSQTSKVDFMGYTDAHGNYVSTNFRRAYEGGGVFLIDEIDSGNANIITTINAATSNHVCGFPDGMVERHEDCILIAAANTFGTGADRQYVGRNQLDAATLDRFPIFEWSYDLKLERQLAGNDSWVEIVQNIREIIENKSIRHIVSPRASIKGAKMLAAGFEEQECLDMLVWKGMDKSTKESIKSAM